MNESKHTPGPWDWEALGQNGHNGLFNLYIVDSTRRKIGTMYGKGDEREANARLIATAPDMLAALRANLAFAEHELELREPSADPDYIKYAKEAVETARAAIAKATGQPEVFQPTAEQYADMTAREARDYEEQRGAS
jgi:hypothetical protein